MVSNGGSSSARNNAPGGSTARATRAWRKHSLLSSETLSIQSKREALKVAILEALCAQNAPGRSTMRPPEALLPRNPTWESSHFSGLTNDSQVGARVLEEEHIVKASKCL